MLKFLILSSILCLFLLVSGIWQPVAAQQPVVVELFTSEGCSSCPPAEAMFIKLSQQRNTSIAHLVLLEEHVTYWNTSSFSDRFSAPVLTDRQAAYVKELHLETSYTPQIVVDGHLQTSGNKPATVSQMIIEEAKAPKPASIALQLVAPDKMQVSVKAPADAKAQVLFAITEDNLSTDVHGGENKGRSLQHDAVVRSMDAIGNLSAGEFNKTVKVPSKSDWKTPDLRAVVLVQDKNSGAMLGAATIPLAANPSIPGR